MHIKTFLTVKERKKKIAYENILKVFLFEDSPGNSLQQMFQQKTVIENRVFQFWRQVWTFYKRSRGWKDFQLMWVRRRSVQALRSAAECLRIVLTLCGSLRHLDFRLTAFAFSSAALLTVEWGMLLIHSSIHLLLSSHSPLVERSSASFTVSFCWTFFFLFSPPVFLFTCFHLSKPPTHFLSLVSGG